MLVHSLQFGQTYPLMFSTMPRTLSLARLQNVSSLLTSPTATAWGVVTRTAPSTV